MAVERKERALRILMINQVFYPDVAATAQHAHDLSRSLVASGHEVSIIASRALYGQKGAALPAYEEIDGIKVHRVGRSFFGTSSMEIAFMLLVLLVLQLAKCLADSKF